VKVALASSAPLLAVVLWVVALLVDPGPLSPWSVFLVGLGMLETVTVGVVGVIVVGGRWAWRTVLAVLALTLVLAVVRPVDTLWFASLLASLGAGVLYLLPVVARGVRKLPAATGPPWRAVVVPLALLGAPAVLGLAAWDGPTAATLVISLTAPVATLWYARVLPGGLLAVRVVWPLLTLGLAAFQPVLAIAAAIALSLLVLVLAWHPDVKVAFHPPREAGTVFPIPPELAPSEVLDAARLDERGRPR
jgi:hypothetical protein